MACMKIQLSNDQIDDVVRKKIAALEKEVRSLKCKLSNRDEVISEMKRVAKFSKVMRERVLDASLELMDSLEDAKWVEYDRYGPY